MTILRNLSLGAILLTGCGLTVPSQAAPPCDDTVAPDPDPRTGYRLREPHVRCEGFYREPVAAPSGLELVAVMRGEVRFGSARNSVLTLTSAVHTQPVILRGVALPEKTYYRLDGVIPRQGSFDWSLTDVVQPRGLLPKDLGLYGRLTESPEVYAPVIVGPAASTQVWVRGEELYARVNWRHAPRRDGRCQAMPRWNTLPPPHSRGEPMRIPLPASISGEICLEVAALPRTGSEWQQGHWSIRASD